MVEDRFEVHTMMGIEEVGDLIEGTEKGRGKNGGKRKSESDDFLHEG